MLTTHGQICRQRFASATDMKNMTPSGLRNPSVPMTSKIIRSLPNEQKSRSQQAKLKPDDGALRNCWIKEPPRFCRPMLQFAAVFPNGGELPKWLRGTA